MMNSSFLEKRSWQIVALFCLAGAVFAQYSLNNWWSNHSYILPVSYNEFIEPQPLTGQAAQVASFGQKDFLADYYWLTMIQYYGGGDPNGTYRKLPDLFNTITDLAPKYLSAYEDGLLILPAEKFTDQAIDLGEKGQKNLPNSWQVPYDEGLVYYINKKDYVSAAKEFSHAATLPGAPANTNYFAALYYGAANQDQVSLQLFETVYQTTSDPYLKDRAGKYIQQIEIISSLNDQVALFKNNTGRYPISLQELVDKKYIPEIPTSPFGIDFKYNSTAGQVSSGK